MLEDVARYKTRLFTSKRLGGLGTATTHFISAAVTFFPEAERQIKPTTLQAFQFSLQCLDAAEGKHTNIQKSNIEIKERKK